MWLLWWASWQIEIMHRDRELQRPSTKSPRRYQENFTFHQENLPFKKNMINKQSINMALRLKESRSSSVIHSMLYVMNGTAASIVLNILYIYFFYVTSSAECHKFPDFTAYKYLSFCRCLLYGKKTLNFPPNFSICVNAVFFPHFSQDLNTVLKKALSGPLEELMLALLMTPSQFDAHRLRQTMEVGQWEGSVKQKSPELKTSRMFYLSVFLCFIDIEYLTCRKWPGTNPF